jgi:hypothetical protein
MWEPQPLATLRASTACMGITLPYLRSFNKLVAMKQRLKSGIMAINAEEDE